MKKGLTHLVFCIDRSGSMKKIASDMIGGFNAFIENQRATPGECIVSAYQFDNEYSTIFEHKKLAEVPELTSETYVPRGTTALFFALKKTIDDYGQYLSKLPENERPERVLIITITDGDNNERWDVTLESVRNTIKHQTEVYKWDFAFLGSDINAWAAGDSLGIDSNATLQFSKSRISVNNAFNSLSDNATVYRTRLVKASYSFTPDDVSVQAANLSLDQQKPK